MTTYNDDDGAFEQLVAGALAQGFSGWDFSCLKERWREMPPPWDYRRRAYEASRNVAALLDQGTGGGEVLASLAPLPP
ncbi:MAG: hypothetical protein JXB35_06000, partial [Anaerolineae bacterium]|nr:hypothetical protein [Anaerolineae bacterium]